MNIKIKPAVEPREITNRVIEMAEDGVISWRDLAEMALKWMSEEDVAEMAKANFLIPEWPEDSEDD